MRESQYLEGRGEICHEQSWKRKQTLLTVLEKIYEVIDLVQEENTSVLLRFMNTVVRM